MMNLLNTQTLRCGLLIASLGFSHLATAGGKDDPLLTMVRIDQLETRADNSQFTADSPVVLEGEAWIGHDLKKLWLTADVEAVDSAVEEATFDLLAGRAIAPYWDIRAGLRQTVKPDSQTWAVVDINGLAPYFFDVNASLAVTSQWQTVLKVSAEYEAMITQRLVLSPDVSVNAYTRSDKAEGIGSGVSDASLGLRLRYEIKREFAPYIGVNWSNKFGQTATFAKQAGGDTSNVSLLVGLSAWF